MSKKISLVLYILITSAPILAGLIYALLYSFGLIGILSKGFTLRYWKTLFSSDAALSMGYTLLLTLASMILILAISLILSYQLSKRPKSFLHKVLFIPLTMPPLIMAFAVFYWMSPGGIISRFLNQLGTLEEIESFPRLVNDFWGVGIIITHVLLIAPLFTLLFTNQVKKEKLMDMADISYTLGGDTTQFFRKIFIPVVLKRSKHLIILYTIFLMGTYEVPLLLGRSTPRVLTIFITENLSRYNLDDIPVAYALTSFYTFAIMITVLIFLTRSKNRSWA